jgi:hypothetical protein
MMNSCTRWDHDLCRTLHGEKSQIPKADHTAVYPGNLSFFECIPAHELCLICYALVPHKRVTVQGDRDAKLAIWVRSGMNLKDEH